MPVLVLLLSLIGNYSIYRNSGKDLVIENNYTYDQLIDNPNFISFSDFNYNSSYSDEGIYADISLSVEELVPLFSSIDSYLSWTDVSYLFPGAYMSYLFNISSSNESDVQYFGLMKIGSDYALFTYEDISYIDIFWSSIEITDLNIVLGWKYNSYNEDYSSYFSPFIFTSNSFSSVHYNDILSVLNTLFAFTPFKVYQEFTSNNLYNFKFEQIIDNTTYYMSFFDITMFNTDNTFKNFQLPFLRSVFESVFNILDFENSYVSSFLLTSFTWMIQLLLLHVVVDTLAFIFKMYHKLMDKVV